MALMDKERLRQLALFALEEAKGQFNSNLQLHEEKLKGDGIRLFSILLHGKTKGNGLELQLWRFIVDETEILFH